MTAVGGTSRSAIAIRRIGFDDHANVRYLHIKAMTAQSLDALTDAEIGAFVAFVNSPAYSDCLMAEDVYGAFIDGQLIGTAVLARQRRRRPHGAHLLRVRGPDVRPARDRRPSAG